MGGTLRKLVLNKNEITVAYMTSGNVAVFDHEVRRYLDWLVRVSGRAGAWTRQACRRCAIA
jgi:glucosamine-6-phosphate deaminase